MTKATCSRSAGTLYGTREIVWTLPASSFDASQEACPSSESNDRMKEVLATLHDESVVVESVFLLSQGGRRLSGVLHVCPQHGASQDGGKNIDA